MSLRCLITVAVPILGLAWTAPQARALDVLDARVAQTASGYEVEFTVHLEGEAAALQRLVMDYGRFNELSPTVIGSRVVRGPPGGAVRIELKLRPCVFVVFCRTLVKTSDVRVAASRRRLEFIAVPALSDFHEAREVVVFENASGSDGPRVRFTYSAFLRPKFFVPPFLGPWLVRRHIIEDLTTTAERVERILRREAAGD